MNIIVCVKQVPDPETPPAQFKIDSQANRVIPASGIPPVLSPFDEQAVEAALRLKDTHGGKISVMTLGNNLTMSVVKKPLSMGADELFILQDEVFEGGDSNGTAYALAMGIQKIGKFDLIICGRQAADWDAGQVGSGIAEILGVPCVTVAKKIDVADGRVKIVRVIMDGYEVLEAPLPCLVTVSNELGEPRYPSIKGIMQGAKKPVTAWTARDIEADLSRVGAAGARTKLLKLFIPVRDSKCTIIEGENPADSGAKLAQALREAKLI
ncbi:MAG: electron transfer flavoprotein subunit beta/FixA family protein [Candidatus Tectomicrobia bacterium]|uniref:Electron transfer flavoprotein subunit beta/FixA family protein n=1 Tax=Tectimicrobiota bacterium TaxID=2528274 RepID=A0A933GJW1_UNCTE|nr:electron transfer flavoprotein subunit beta/FixA family protein [Candidatus Tectomicrobia bacterium]